MKWSPTLKEISASDTEGRLLLLVHLPTGNTRPQSSQLAKPLWSDAGVKCRSVYANLSPLKKKKKRRQRMKGRTFSRNPRKRGKSHHTHQCRGTSLTWNVASRKQGICAYTHQDIREHLRRLQRGNQRIPPTAKGTLLLLVLTNIRKGFRRGRQRLRDDKQEDGQRQ